jgi:VCBS repeat-containing protein
MSRLTPRWAPGMVALCAAVLLAASVALAASAAHHATRARAAASHSAKSEAAASMRFACAKAQFGVGDVLHWAHSARACARAHGIPVDFVRDRPVRVCREKAGAGTKGSPDGLLRLVDAPGDCSGQVHAAEVTHALPRRASERFCAHSRRRALRMLSNGAACSRGERAVVLRKRAGKQTAVVAADNGATTGEDAPVEIDVLANDRPGLALRSVHVKTIVRGDAHGRIARGPRGKLAYDPRGKFDALKPGQVGHDSFAYVASDGVHTDRATVHLTLRGANDAPDAVGDSAATSEDAPAVNIDVVKAGAPKGTAGKDTDPEGDALTSKLVDAKSAKGATLTRKGNGTIDYDPAGKLEALGAGQTGKDSFRYTVSDPPGAKSAPATVRVSVTGENDSPALSGVDSGPAFAPPGLSATPVADTIAVSDPDSNPGLGGQQMAGATATISGGYDATHHDRLTFDPQPGITGSFDTSTGALTLTGTASRASYEQALRSISFTTDADTPDSGGSGQPDDRTVSFQVDDGASSDHASNVVARTVRVSHLQIGASPSLTPAFEPDVGDYAVRCTDGQPIDVSVDAPGGTTVSVDGNAAQSGAFHQNVTLNAGQGFAIVVTHASSSTTYHARCLPSDFPGYTATVPGNPQAQWFFVTPTQGASNRYAAVFNDDGVPVWWMKSPPRPDPNDPTQPATPTSPFDFKLLADGNVAWAVQGSDPAILEYTLAGSLAKTTRAVGWSADNHDYQELPNGNRYILLYRLRDHVDVHQYTGRPEDTDAAVLDAEVQELDPDGNLVWSWNAATHVSFDETGHWWENQDPIKTLDGQRNVWDPDHINSVEPDGPNHIIISLRHTDAIYRIDKTTGEIEWKLGGSQTPQSLTILNDPFAAADFGGQHDARRLPDGTVSLHDNGTARPFNGDFRQPRALRYDIDPAAKTATLVESVTDPAPLQSKCCGSARKLPGGDWVMSWGSIPFVTELAPDGSRVYKLTFNQPFSYRANPVLPGVLPAADLRAGMDAQHPRP